MDNDYKKQLISSAVTMISDEFSQHNNKHPELHELGDWCLKFWHNKETIFEILSRRSQQQFSLKQDHLAKYPNFLNDLWAAIQQGKINRPLRSEREVT